MPEASTVLLFAVAALSLNLTPGPDMLYVIARSVNGGRSAGIVSALGLCIGYVVYTLLVASGVAALLLSVPAAFTVIKFGGACYLLYLGLRTLVIRPTVPAAAAAPSPASEAAGTGETPTLRQVFRQGALTSTLNPSIALFFLAFLPQFVNPARGMIATQIILLGLVFNTTATLTHTSIALLTGTASDWLRQRQAGSGRWQRWFTGGLLILLGARVLLTGG